MADLSLPADSVRSNPTPFDRALQRYLYALNRLRAETDNTDENMDFGTDALITAEDGLMRQPANDLHQLRVKADLLWSDPSSIPCHDHMKAFFADLRRLTGDTPSPFFNAAQWLKYFELHGGMWAVRDGEALLLVPEGADLADDMTELEVRGGRPVVEALILARHEAQEA